MAIDKKGTKQIADNRKARHDYFVLEQIECGIELVGTEVKSIRNGGVNLKDSWCSIEDGEMWVKGMHISPYEHGNIFNRDPRRERKLLLHKREILRLFGKWRAGFRSAGWRRNRVKFKSALSWVVMHSFLLYQRLPW